MTTCPLQSQRGKEITAAASQAQWDGVFHRKQEIGWGIVPHPLVLGLVRKRHVIQEFQDSQGYMARPCPNHVMWALHLCVNGGRRKAKYRELKTTKRRGSCLGLGVKALVVQPD